VKHLLQSGGLRCTGPRVAVLRQLAKQPAPISHGDLADELAHLGFDRATIYRNLTDLTEAGLVVRNDLDHVWRFELNRGGVEHRLAHPHLVCSDCGTVSCLSDVDVVITSRQGTRKKRRRVEIERLEVQLRGLCERCA
jgi:Fur family transcriptional regulator, ferric uptake regulator